MTGGLGRRSFLRAAVTGAGVRRIDNGSGTRGFTPGQRVGLDLLLWQASGRNPPASGGRVGGCRVRRHGR